MLETPAARAEVADVLADQLVERTGIPPDSAPTVSQAVEEALADPRVAQNLIDAFGSEHARALGVDDPRPTSIDTQAIVTAAQEHLAVAAPSIAAALQTALSGVVIPPLELPDLHTDSAGRLRDAADSATTSLAIVAVALLVAAFVVGDRRHVVRRFGTWAVFSGIGWLAGPYLVAAIAKQMSDFDATIDAIREAVQGPVITGAIVLVAAGAVALFAWMMPIWQWSDVDGGRRTAGGRARRAVDAAPAGAARTARSRWRHPRPHPHCVRPMSMSSRPQPTLSSPSSSRRTSSRPSSTATSNRRTSSRRQQPYGAAPPPATVPTPAAGATAERRPAAEDQDPWSIYFGEAQREK